MHQAGDVREGLGDCAGDEVIGDVEDREPVEPADVGRKRSGELVSNEIEDSEERQVRDAPGNLAGDSLPVGDGDTGEPGQPADGGRDGPGHVTGPFCSLKNGVLGLPAQVYVRDPTGLLVAANTIPLVAAVGAGP